MSDQAKPALLSVQGIDVAYGHVGVLENVSLEIADGSLVALAGSNGAGKTTLLRTLSGLLAPKKGTIAFDGQEIGGKPPHEVVEFGILQVAEGRRLFRSQSVRDNLELGLYGTGMGAADEKERYEMVLELFPALAGRLDVKAGILSGGQQQMLAIGQALMRRPRLLLLDEPSLGLAPIIIDQVMEVLQNLNRSGITILLVEQMVERALEISDYVYVMQSGRIIGSGTPAELHGSELLKKAYLGMA